MTDLILKAHELARALEEAPEVLRFRQLEAEMLNDPMTLKELEAYKHQQETPNISEKLQNYLEASKKVDNLVQAINFLLNKALGTEETFGGGCNGCCRFMKN